MMENNSLFRLKFCEIMKTLLVESAIKEREERKKKMIENCVTLGRPSFERHLSDVAEVWLEGSAFKEIREREEKINREKAQIEQERKALKKLKGKGLQQQQQQLQGGNVRFEESEEYISQRDEIFKLQLKELRKKRN